MASKPRLQETAAENQDLRARLEKAEESLREILSGEADALFVTGVGGAQLFALKGADQSYRTLIENMSEGALTLTPEGLILYANRRFAEMLRTPLEKVIGSHIYTWFAPASRQVLQTLLRKDATDGRREELALVAADGKQVPVNLSMSHLILEGMPDSFCMVATDLTEQKRNEAMLAADKLARAILEQSADAIVICDAAGRVIRASKQAQAFYGNNPLGQHFDHAFSLRELDGAAFPPIGVIDTSRGQSVEARLERDGQVFILLVSIGHLKDARNELLGSVVTLTDITEHKRVVDLLKLSEQRLALALESGRMGVWDLDLIHNTSWRSLQHDRIFGYESLLPEWDQAIFLRHVVSEDRDRVSQCFDEALRTDRLDFECQIILQDQGQRWILAQGQVYRDEKATPIRMMGVVLDISERKKAEAALQRSEAKFRTLAESMPQIVWITRPDGWNIYFNQQWMDYTGMTLEESHGHGWNKPFHPDDQQRAWDAWQEAVSIVGIYSIESRLRRADGVYRWWLVRGVPLKDAGGNILKWFGTCTDIHDIKMAELEISNSNAALRESETAVKRLNRVYAMLSGINTLIVRVRDREELFREACQIAVEEGGFRMAVIGIVDSSAMKIVAVGTAGVDDEFLTALNDRFSSIEDVPLGNTIAARVIREKRLVIIEDLQTNPDVVFGKKYAESGVRSAAVFPLMVADEAVGVFVLYASQIEFFQEEEMKLLSKLAGDIAFAIDHIEKQERLDYLAYYDVLTGLANRTLFHERLQQGLVNAREQSSKVALVLLDIERFKGINDSLGRQAGDALLKELAARLSLFAVDTGRLARIDADHFAIMVLEVQTEEEVARRIEQRIKEIFVPPFQIGISELRISGKFGIAMFPADGVDADTLFRNAEAALRSAKASGARYLFYTRSMNEYVAEKLTLENQLRQAIDNNEFVLHYQPKVNLASGKVTSAEALIRWNDPLTGLVPPGRFISILEETGLIYDVGRWALRQAIADYLRWRTAGLPAVRIAVNVSPLQLRNRGFIDEIAGVIAIDQHAADGLELEITESVIMEDVKYNIASLQAIRDMGICIAIDDFGTGFSSLAYLAKLPVHTLKIDRSFVIDMTAGPQGLALVSTIITLAHSLKLKVVAEGVETEEQRRLLHLLGCDEMQGFLFSKPLPGEMFEARYLALAAAVPT